MKVSKELIPAVKFAEANGWGIKFTTKGHVMFIKSGCTSVTTSGSPSDHRVVKNCLARLRRFNNGAAVA